MSLWREVRLLLLTLRSSWHLYNEEVRLYGLKKKRFALEQAKYRRHELCPSAYLPKETSFVSEGIALRRSYFHLLSLKEKVLQKCYGAPEAG